MTQANEDEWFIVLPRTTAELAFEEWEGKVPRSSSLMPQLSKPCVICGANHTVCTEGKGTSGDQGTEKDSEDSTTSGDTGRNWPGGVKPTGIYAEDDDAPSPRERKLGVRRVTD